MTAIPLLAWLRTLPAGQLSLADHERAVRAVESWCLRRAIVGGNTRGYGGAFLAVLKQAQQAARTSAPVADAVVAALAGAPNSLAWPDDATVTGALATTPVYKTMTQERIRLFLGTIDQHMRHENPHAEPAEFDYDRLQIEHVMPRGWREHWPIGDGPHEAAGALAEVERDALVHRMGNLTLVTNNFNRSLSNRAWTLKKNELSKQSSLQLNAGFGQLEAWDEASIRARARDLAAVACRVWPTAEAFC